MESSRCTVAGVAAVFLIGCSDAQRVEERAEEPAAVRHLTFRYLDERPPADTITAVHGIEIPPSLEAWRIEAHGHQIVEARGTRLLFLTGDVLTVRIPCHVPAGSFDLLALRGRFLDDCSATLSLGGDEGVARVRERKITGRAGDQVVLFDDFGSSRTKPPVTWLELIVEGPAKTICLTRVDLLRTAVLPEPGSDRPFVEIGGDRRRGVGLSSGRPLESELEVGLHEELVFSYGAPRDLRLGARDSELRVTLQAASGDVAEHTFDVPDTLRGPMSWREARLALAGLAGEAVRVRFALADETGQERHCALANAYVGPRVRSPRTVLLVTSDTHRADHLGGSEPPFELRTPALDAFARRGLLFENCFSSTNVTQPSHVAIMTGIHPRDTRLVTNQGWLVHSARTLAEVFHEAGFLTYASVSTHHLNRCGLDQGFDRILAPPATRPVRDAEHTIGAFEAWLPDAEGRPLFAWIHLFDAHTPYGPPAPFDRLYYDKDRDPYDPSLPDPGAKFIPREYEDLRDLRYAASQYRAEITYLDHELGRILRTPRFRSGVAAVTSDHGEILERDGSYFNHAELCADTQHVPLILAWPGARAGHRVADPVSQLDLARTLLDLSGLHDEPFPGRNLVEPGRGYDAPRFGLSVYGFSASVSLSGWYCVLHLRDQPGRLPVPRKKHEVELYDLRDDSKRGQNLVDIHPERARKLRQLLVQWLRGGSQAGLTAPANMTTREIEQLRALGYITNVDASSSADWFEDDCNCGPCARYR